MEQGKMELQVKLLNPRRQSGALMPAGRLACDRGYVTRHN